MAPPARNDGSGGGRRLAAAIFAGAFIELDVVLLAVMSYLLNATLLRYF